MRQIKQVVLNLVTNAVKFTPPGGRITISAPRRQRGAGQRPRIPASASPTAEQAASSRRSSGAPTGRTSRRGRVSGSLCRADRRAARRANVGGERTRRRKHLLVLPLPPAPSGAAPSRRRGERSARRPAAVLVEDDDRRSADLLSLYLEDAGFDIAVARDGVEGLELARRLRPRAVHPRHPAAAPRRLGVARAAKAIPSSRVPVVIVSMVDERNAGFALGAADYLVKPVDARRTAPRADTLSRAAGLRNGPRDRRRPDDLDLLEAVLEPLGWTVLAAQSGEEGVVWSRRERPDLVLLDLLMPDVDGFTVVEQLKADPRVADVPIVVLTSKDMTADDQSGSAGRISVSRGRARPQEPSSSRSSAGSGRASGRRAMSAERAHPDRGGQPEQPEARSRPASPPRIRDARGETPRTRWRSPRQASRI